MVIIGKSQIAGGTAKRLEFEYTGTYNERLEDGVVELLTSGVLTFKKEAASVSEVGTKKRRFI